MYVIIFNGSKKCGDWQPAWGKQTMFGMKATKGMFGILD